MRNFLMRRSKDIGGGVRFGGIPPGCEANRRLQPLTAKHDFDGENRSFQFAFRGGISRPPSRVDAHEMPTLWH